MPNSRIAVVYVVALLCVSCGRITNSDTDENGRTRLMRAAGAGNVTEVRQLARRSDVNKQVKGHSDARQLIAFLSWMQQLPERKAGWTALMFAVDSTHPQVVTELVQRGADPNLGAGPYTSLTLALMKHPPSVEIVRVLLKAGASPETHGWPRPLQQAAEIGDTAIVRLLLDASASLEIGRGETPLITAIKGRHTAVAQQLLRAGANVNAADSAVGWPALGWAIHRGADEIADALRHAGADPKAELDQALLAAVHSNDPAAVTRLLASGANPNMTNESRHTVISTALGNGQQDIAFALLAAGAIIPPQDRGSMLYTAAFTGADSMVRMLLSAGEKPTYTHLGAAAAGGRLSTIKVLLDAGADPNGVTGEPLREAIRGNHADAVRALIEAGADVNKEQRGENPLDYAVRGRAVEATAVLLEAGADAKKPRASPLLYTPIVYEDTASAVLLLRHGADINAKDSRGLTVLDHAHRLKKPPAIIRFLERNGAKPGTS